METRDGNGPVFDVADQLSARMAQLGQEHCVFVRNGQLYAIGIGAAREVLIGESITIVPQAPEVLVGVLNLRGEVLPLLRLDTLLDLPARAYVAADDQVLVLSSGGTDLGVIVDRVREVRPIDPKQITATSKDGLAPRLFKGSWEGPSGRVIILDADELVSNAVALVARGFGERRTERHPADGAK